MTKQAKKGVFTAVFAVLAGFLCIIAYSACSQGEHLHEFNKNLWVAEEGGHYHPATCGHTDQKDGYAPHEYDQDFVCTVCQYRHEHSYDLTRWQTDQSGHYNPATCGHDVKLNFAAHSDENGDELCDVCGFAMPHVHQMSEEWTVTQTEHWHVSTCHSEYTEGRAAHTFIDGVCECGVKEIETQVYNIYVAREGNNASTFADWLAEVKEQGVTDMRISENDDVIYSYEGGSEQIIYVSKRTVNVKAENQTKQPVAGVYVKVICIIDGVTQKFNNGATDALAIGVTGTDGIAEIEFTPIGGFSSEKVQYSAKIPEEKDIEQILGIPEESAFAVPNRYLYNDADNIISFEVTEDTNGEEVGAFKLTYSRGISAYRMLNLPYRRYYNNPIKAEGIQEKKENLTFKASGNGLYDYITFTPYDVLPAYAPYRHPSDADKIINNSEEVASGIYKISFTVEERTNATLYLWDEEGFDPNVSKFVGSEGVPLDKYLTAISGEGEGDKYSGIDSIEVTVEQEFATKSFQLAILTDNKCTVTVSVAWLYSVDDVTDYTIDWSNAENDAVTVTQLVLNKYTATKIGLENFEPGLYQISLLNELGAFTKSADKYRIYTNDCKDEEMMLWEYTTLAANTDEYKAVLNFTEATARLFINNSVTAVYADLKIEKYTFPDLGTDPVYLPVTTVTAERYNIPLSSTLNGEYTVSLITCGLTSLCNNLHDIVVYIGDRQYTLTTEDNSTNDGLCVYTGNISIETGDTNLSLAFAYNAAPIPYSLMAQTTLTKAEAL